MCIDHCIHCRLLLYNTYLAISIETMSGTKIHYFDVQPLYQTHQVFVFYNLMTAEE